MASLGKNFQQTLFFTILILLSSIVLLDASYSLFEYVCDEKMLYEPYLHVYEHRKGRRILDRGVGFHTLDQMSNVYVCINGPAYLFYSRTTELGVVYEAPQSGVFAHICEMHNVVPHKNASKTEYILHLMAVLVYGDKDDYRKPGVQTFTAPYYFEENEYGPGFPEHYQNATSVAVIGDGTCTIKKEGPDTPNIPPVIISVMSVWPPVPEAPAGDPPPNPDDYERDNYVCKQGFSELQSLAKAFTPTAPPELPPLASPDTAEPEPKIDDNLVFGDALEKMRLFVNDWPITFTECLSDVFDENTYDHQIDNLKSQTKILADKMKAGHDLTTIKTKYGDKIFRARKSFEAQNATLQGKLEKLKPGSTQIKRIQDQMDALNLTIIKEREKYYPFAVNLKFALAVFEGLQLTDAAGKVADPLPDGPPAKLEGKDVNWDELLKAAKTGADELKVIEDKITAIESEVLVNLLALKTAKAAKKKLLEDPTTGLYKATKEIYDNVAKWKLGLSKAEVWYSIVIEEFDKHKKGPIVYPEKPDARKKKKGGRALSYSRSTIPQHLYIVGEGATDPDAEKPQRRKRQADELYSAYLDPESSLSNISHWNERMPYETDNYDFNGDPVFNFDAFNPEDEFDADFKTKIERPKRLFFDKLNYVETNEVPEIEQSNNKNFEFDVESKSEQKRQSPVSLLPKCEKLPKLRGEDGECRKGKPHPEVACGLLAHTTGHREAFPEGNERDDNWKKEILDVIGDIFIQACPNFYHRKHFVKKLINAYTYYLTSAEHFGQPPKPGVSQACQAYRAWQENATNPVLPEIIPSNITTQERNTFWSEILLLTIACRDARKSLSFVSYEKADDELDWKFITARDRREVDVTTYSEQAEKEYIFNWVIDSLWKMFATTHGICMGGYEVNNALISSRFYHLFSEDFLIPLAETWVNPRDNLIFQWVFSEFYYGDAEEWLDRCMNAGYMFSERDSYRPIRPLLVNCRSEYNYLTNINAPYLNDLYYDNGKKIVK